MNDFTTEILKTLANKGDLNELFRVHLEKAVNWSSSRKVHRLAENPLHRAQDQLLFLWIIIKAIENKETTDHLNCSCYTR